MARNESIAIALDALRAHKLRSFLTVLGVIIGVATVIAVVSVLQGFNEYMTSRVMDFGSTSFSLSKFTQGIRSMDDFLRENRRRNLTYDDFLAVERGCAHCQLVSANFQDIKTVKYKGQSINTTQLRGVTVQAAFIGQVMELESGRHFTETDIDHARYETVIGGDVADRLFPHEDPLGKEVIVDGTAFTVIGVAKKSGDFLGQPQDTFVRIPITVYMKMYNAASQSVVIQAQAATPAEMQLAIDESRMVMRNRHHRMYSDEDDFSIATADTMLDMWSNMTSAVFLVTTIVAGISLVVGAIVIMNIMLVSVTERTHEIGVRKALGARRSDILRQFLAEAVALALAGGALGVTLGVAFALIVSRLASLPVVVRIWSVVMALAVASTIGIAAGIYPASRAARMDPVTALRAD
ncbi:MAG TPA: ABC transporter permease [Terriglobales bacterium]|jgi:putative ABC transport system permease protein|nr:ABC transporter permease [Terriglobales bacterium]